MVFFFSALKINIMSFRSNHNLFLSTSGGLGVLFFFFFIPDFAN